MRETVRLEADVNRLQSELAMAKERLQDARAADVGNLYGADLLLSLAAVMDNAGAHITLSTKRREAIAWACRIAAAQVPELVKAAAKGGGA